MGTSGKDNEVQDFSGSTGIDSKGPKWVRSAKFVNGRGSGEVSDVDGTAGSSVGGTESNLERS